jgi:pimeloyl-ACP methyl ester carboxylesterase/class 3 adenylate cyclase
MEQARTSYARNGDASIAYQVVGSAPVDLVLVPGFVSHLDLWWGLPETAAFVQALASFTRLILFDKRGTGLSDPVAHVPTLEERMEDMHAVLDAAGSERPALLGVSEGGPLGISFAATYPERVSSLIIYGSSPRFSSSADFLPERHEFFERVRRDTASIVEHWGEGRSVELFWPSAAGDEGMTRAVALWERASASPAMVRAVFAAWWELDVTDVLGVIGVPTLVVHKTGDRVLPIEAGRYLASAIPDSRLVEQPGVDHFLFVDQEPLIDEIERFLTGATRRQGHDRVLATVLFTDIVSSTDRAAELGDQRWRELLEAHDVAVRRQVELHGGRVVKSLGDGYLATFTGPARAIRCGCQLADDAKSLGLQLRVAAHTGECELLGDDVAGIAVHISARVLEQALPGEMLVTSSVRDLVVGSGIQFSDRGTHDLKGVPGQWTLLAAEPPGRPPSQMPATRVAPDRLAPNLEAAQLGDRTTLRIVRHTPAVARLLFRVSTRSRQKQPPRA